MHLSNDRERTPSCGPRTLPSLIGALHAPLLHECQLRWSHTDLQGNAIAVSKGVGREGAKEEKVTLTSMFTALSENC